MLAHLLDHDGPSCVGLRPTSLIDRDETLLEMVERQIAECEAYGVESPTEGRCGSCWDRPPARIVDNPFNVGAALGELYFTRC